MTSPETPHVPVIPPPRFFFAVSITAGLCFAGWTWFVQPGTAVPPTFDLECAQFWRAWSAAHAGPWGLMVFMTDIGGVAGNTLVAIMGAIWQTALNRRFLAVAWLGIVVGGGLINMATKHTFDRPRPAPVLRDRAVLESNQSYPSGHSMGSMVGYGLLGYALILPQRRRPRRIATVLLMTCIVLTVGFSRIYLRAHWFSDVIAGWSIGLCWVSVCIACLEMRRRRLLAQAL